MERKRIYWLIGLIDGDGYTNDRKVEIYNSSPSILKEAVDILKKLGVPKEKIKVDVYSSQPKNIKIAKWGNTLWLPSSSFKARMNTSPWKERKDKLRLRVHSKRLVSSLRSKKPSGVGYVKGLFDAEASVDIKGYIEFKQKARAKGLKITKTLHKILSARNMLCTPVRIKNDMDIKNDAYFYVKNLEKYAKDVNFIDKEKKRKLGILLRVRKLRGRAKNMRPSLKTTGKQKLWDLMDELGAPYHTLRKYLAAR